MKQFNAAAVVRYFNDDEQRGGRGQPQDGDEHHLLGWALGREASVFFAATGAFLDVDEYDMTASPPSD